MLLICSFLERIARVWLRQLPLFIMLVLYTTLPTFFTVSYSYKSYLLFVMPQAVLPSLLLCFLADRWRWLWYIIFIFGNLLWLIELGCYFHEDQRMCSKLAIVIGQSNPRESGEFLCSAYGDILKGILTVAVCAVVIYISDRLWSIYSKKIIMKLQVGRRILIRCIGLLLSFSLLYSSVTLYGALRQNKGYVARMEALKYYSGTSSWLMYPYILNDVFDNPDMKTLPRLIETMVSAEVSLENDKDSLAIVYVIGESFSRNHSSLYGYPYDTNPLMAKELADSSLIVFNNVISREVYTLFAYRYLLSTYNIQGNIAFENYPFLPALMKKAGYKVAYFDNQETMSKGRIDFTVTYFLSDDRILDLCFDTVNTEGEKYDLDFINSNPPLAADQSAKSCTIYHLLGQHFDYDERYPEDFRYFTKDSYSSCKDLNERGAIEMSDYDNATRYNDYVIYSIIDRLRDKNAVLVYTPDHGEEVYDYREFSGRAEWVPLTSIRLINEVPLMIWTSDKFKQKYPEVVKGLRNNAGKPIYNSDIPHTILDIAGITTPTFNPEVSLLREGTGRTHRHVVTRDIDYDASRDVIYRQKLRYE